MRVFLDANVIFSAARNPNGNARALFDLAPLAAITLVVSRYAIDEATRNIALKSPDCMDDLASLVALLATTPEPTPGAVDAVRDEGLPDKDAPILAAAVSARADLLVTGDRRDFGHLYGRVFRTVRVVTPADGVSVFLARV